MCIGFGKLVQVLAASALLIGSSVSQAQEIRSHNMRFALQPAKGSAQVDGAQHFADLVKEKSGGKMRIKVFEGGTLGSDASTLSAMTTGTIDFSLMSTGTLAGHDKAFMLFDFPYLFNNGDEADAIMDGPVGERLAARLPPKGLRILGYAELGFRQVHNSKGPITKIEDFSQLKLRVIPLPMYLDFIASLGANAVPLPFTELYTALDQKAVDGATNPYDNIASSKLYEVNKYLSISNHMYSTMVFLMGNKSWEKLNAAEQKVIVDAGIEAALFERKVSREKNAARFEDLKKVMQVNEIPASEIAKIKEKARAVGEKWKAEISPELVDEMYAELAKIRAKK